MATKKRGDEIPRLLDDEGRRGAQPRRRDPRERATKPHESAVSAGEVHLAAHPNHVLNRPAAPQGGVVGRILIVSLESELERGEFYFLIPASSVPDAKRRSSSAAAAHARSKSEGSAVTGRLSSVGSETSTTTAKKEKK
uniref:Uncharacterized protein n=1 Tax=Leersia perrieri TaxID=77586 RepID=A0A0D9WS55_9ORYZ